jgi:hypothetical protein
VARGGGGGVYEFVDVLQFGDPDVMAIYDVQAIRYLASMPSGYVLSHQFMVKVHEYMYV